ncbi:MAG: ribosomal protein S18-alanine N-acetyltransferase [Rhodanobacteraceae bacterium]
MSAIRATGPLSVTRVRRARATDLAALVELENRVFETERITPRQWRRYLAGASVEVLVATCAGAAVGAAVLFFRAKSNTARLYSIALADEVRGRGIGTALLASAERAARHRGITRMVLEVRSDNVAAQGLYERRGYRRFAISQGYYEDGHDALRYEKNLVGAEC